MREKILLTGATGFLGSHLLESLVSQEFEVAILKRDASNTSRIMHLMDKVESFNIDQYSVSAIFNQFKPEIILHTACSYGRDNESLSQILYTNLMFGISLLEEAVKNNVTTFINTDTLLPKNVSNYSLSKSQFSDWLQKYSKPIQVINFRIEHVYGTRDDKKKFIPWLINEMLNGKEEINLTSGLQKRDFIYVSDVIAAYNLVLQKRRILPSWSEFDLGTGFFTEVKELVVKIASILENEHNIEIIPRLKFGSVPYREEDVMMPELDNKKIIELGWYYQVDVNKGVELITKEYI